MMHRVSRSGLSLLQTLEDILVDGLVMFGRGHRVF